MKTQLAILIAVLLLAVLSVRCKGSDLGSTPPDFRRTSCPQGSILPNSDGVMLKVCPTPPPDAPNPVLAAQVSQDQHRTAARHRRQNIVKGFIAVSVTVTVIRW